RQRLEEMGAPPPTALGEEQQSVSRSVALADFLQTLKQLPGGALQALADSCPADAEPHALDWEQVRALEASGLVRFGPHGASHTILTQLDSSQLERDMRDCIDVPRQRCQPQSTSYLLPL